MQFPIHFDVFIALAWVLAVSVYSDFKIITKPLYLDENLYFEVVLPEEIAYTFKIRPAKDFGIFFNQTYSRIELVLADPFHGCSEIANTIYINNNIAFIERGGCSFLSKTINAERAGALGVIITDNEADSDKMIDMVQDDTGRTASIPALFMLGKDGHMIRGALEKLNLQSALINLPVNMTNQANSKKQPPWTLW